MELCVGACMAVNELLDRFSFCLSYRLRLLEAYISDLSKLCGCNDNNYIDIWHERLNQHCLRYLNTEFYVPILCEISMLSVDW